MGQGSVLLVCVVGMSVSSRYPELFTASCNSFSLEIARHPLDFACAPKTTRFSHAGSRELRRRETSQIFIVRIVSDIIRQSSISSVRLQFPLGSINLCHVTSSTTSKYDQHRAVKHDTTTYGLFLARSWLTIISLYSVMSPINLVTLPSAHTHS